MQKIIGVTDLLRRFRTVMDDIRETHVPYVLTRGSRPEAALVSYEDFLRFQELDEREVLSRFDRLTQRMAKRNRAFSEEEIAADVAAARTEISR